MCAHNLQYYMRDGIVRYLVVFCRSRGRQFLDVSITDVKFLLSFSNAMLTPVSGSLNPRSPRLAMFIEFASACSPTAPYI